MIPPGQVVEILSHCHDQALAGHLGAEKSERLISKRFFWPNMTKDIRTYIRTCLPCQLRKRDYHKVHSPLQPMTTLRPFQRIAIDIVKLPPSAGYCCALIAIDYATRWPEAFPLRNHTAPTVAKVLFHHIICRFGVPEIIHSDRGAEFQSELLAELYRLCGIKRTRTTAYHPQGDGLVERQIQSLTNILGTVGNKR